MDVLWAAMKRQNAPPITVSELLSGKTFDTDAAHYRVEWRNEGTHLCAAEKLPYSQVYDSELTPQEGKHLVGCTIVAILYGILCIADLLMHTITIWAAALQSGFLAALIAFSLTIVAEIFWFFKLWALTGNFFNLFNIGILFLVLLHVVVGFGMHALRVEK